MRCDTLLIDCLANSANVKGPGLVPICCIQRNTMDNNSTISASDTDESDREAISRFFARVGTGFRKWTREQRSVAGRVSSAAQWQTKRLRYGPTGRKPQDYRAWRDARGLPRVEATFEDKEKP